MMDPMMSFDLCTCLSSLSKPPVTTRKALTPRGAFTDIAFAPYNNPSWKKFQDLRQRSLPLSTEGEERVRASGLSVRRRGRHSTDIQPNLVIRNKCRSCAINHHNRIDVPLAIDRIKTPHESGWASPPRHAGQPTSLDQGDGKETSAMVSCKWPPLPRWKVLDP
jgi:hypothetical protein